MSKAWILAGWRITPRLLSHAADESPWVERFASLAAGLGFPQRFVLKRFDEESQSNYISDTPGEMRIEITDYGCGFDPTAVKSGHGLGNTRERAAMMKAEISLTASPGNGNRVILAIPRGRRRTKP